MFYSRDFVSQQGLCFIAGASFYSRGLVLQQGLGCTAGALFDSRGFVFQPFFFVTAGGGFYSGGLVLQQRLPFIWAPVSEPGFWDFHISRFCMLEMLKMFETYVGEI